MKNISNTLLKNGLQNLIYEDDEAFKKSLIDTLSLKLNDAIADVEKSFKSEMMYETEKFEESEDVKSFIKFIENYDPKLNNSLVLKDNCKIHIKENEFDAIKKLFDSLNPKNRKTLVETSLKSVSSFKQNVDFYLNARKTLS
jgi:hypothetical protein